jgi:hypothetical protein
LFFFFSDPAVVGEFPSWKKVRVIKIARPFQKVENITPHVFCSFAKRTLPKIPASRGTYKSLTPYITYRITKGREGICNSINYQNRQLPQ